MPVLEKFAKLLHKSGIPIRACNPGLPLMEGLGVPGPENPQDCRTRQNYESGVSQIYDQVPATAKRHELPYFAR